MSNAKSYEISTRILFDMQDLIKSRDREKFLRLLRNDGFKLNNCVCGDSYLQGKVIEVYRNALENLL